MVAQTRATHAEGTMLGASSACRSPWASGSSHELPEELPISLQVSNLPLGMSAFLCVCAIQIQCLK